MKQETISATLRRKLLEAKSVLAVERDAGLGAGHLYRFVNGERSITLDTADKLAKALGLMLVDNTKR